MDLTSLTNELTYEQAIALVDEKLGYLAPNKSVVFIHKPATKSRLQLTDGAKNDRDKHIIIKTGVEGINVGEECIVLGNLNIGLFEKKDLAVVEDHTILLTFKNKK